MNTLPRISLYALLSILIVSFSLDAHAVAYTGKEDYVYTNNQLLQNDLKSEEHANAVDTWFYVDFGLENNQIVANPNPKKHQVGYKSAWVTVLRSLGWDEAAINSIDFSGDYWQSAANLQSHVDFFFKNVVKEVDPSPPPALKLPISF